MFAGVQRVPLGRSTQRRSLISAPPSEGGDLVAGEREAELAVQDHGAGVVVEFDDDVRSARSLDG